MVKRWCKLLSIYFYEDVFLLPSQINDWIESFKVIDDGYNRLLDGYDIDTII